jgi:hypothetical protein
VKSSPADFQIKFVAQKFADAPVASALPSPAQNHLAVRLKTRTWFVFQYAVCDSLVISVHRQNPGHGHSVTPEGI